MKDRLSPWGSGTLDAERNSPRPIRLTPCPVGPRRGLILPESPRPDRELLVKPRQYSTELALGYSSRLNSDYSKPRELPGLLVLTVAQSFRQAVRRAVQFRRPPRENDAHTISPAAPQTNRPANSQSWALWSVVSYPEDSRFLFRLTAELDYSMSRCRS